MSFQTKISTTLLALALTTGSLVAQAKTLPENVVSAIGEALNDEYHAEAVYAAALAKYGDVRPFSNIINAEQTHAAALVNLLDEYGIAAAANPYQNGEKSIEALPDTLSEACTIGAEAEVLNLNLYDEKLLPVVAGFPDIQKVFTSLRDASEFKHLPAFQKCASGGKGQGMGKGKGSHN